MGENEPLNNIPTTNVSYPKEPPDHHQQFLEHTVRKNSHDAVEHCKSFQRRREPPEKPILYASPYLQNRKMSSHNTSSSNSRSLYQHQQSHPATYDAADYSSTTSDDDETSSEALYRSTVHRNRLHMEGADADLDAIEHLYEDRIYRGSEQVVLRPFLHSSPFANIGKTFSERVPRSAIFPNKDQNCPTFLCPRCGTRQRQFFTVENVSGQLEGPGSYLAFYFAIYVMCSLFIFGLEEGWMPLDCIYFAVITLTTAGLGDFVPTSNANKIICSVFIYFGVACIGLLLGSYIAGMLDDKAYKESKQKQIESCPNCAKLKMFRDQALRQERRNLYSTLRTNSRRKLSIDESHDSLVDRTSPLTPRGEATPLQPASDGYHTMDPNTLYPEPFSPQKYSFSERRNQNTRSPSSFNHNPLLGSPMTRQILGRQSHTRHISFDVGSKNFASPPLVQKDPPSERKQSSSGRPTVPLEQQQHHDQRRVHALRGSAPASTGRSAQMRLDADYSSTDSEEDSSILSSSTYSSTESFWDDKKANIQNAKYVFLTLRKALINSMVIIAVGCVGFVLIEDFDPIDSWYFTTVLLTTVGYGDIVPSTKGGKLFATIYILVAGTILLNNMSTISMIPLELRRRRIEKAVLTQFGEHLDDEALRELATGPLVQRLKLSTNRSDGLNECTREMFSLAMLVRLGKVTDQDIRETFAAFRHLDVNNEGVLNSKSIIGGMIKQHRTTRMNVPPPPPSQTYYEPDAAVYGAQQRYWYGNQQEQQPTPGVRSAREAQLDPHTERSPLVP